MSGVVLHHHEYGDPTGPAVVALHGVRGHGERWRHLAASHLTGFRVCGLDLRGHGRSDWRPPWSIGQHVADVLTTVDSLGVDVAYLVGHSFGGFIAAHLAHAAPHWVRGLVLLDPAGGLPPDVAAARAHEEMVQTSFPTVAEAREARIATTWERVPGHLVDEEVAAHAYQGSDGRWRWRFEPAAIVTAYSDMVAPLPVPSVGMPTLLVAATRGSTVPAGYAEDCRATLGDAFVGTAVDSAHMVYLERPDETGSAVHAFLTGLEAGGVSDGPTRPRG